MNRDEFILSEFKKALLKNAVQPVINMDEKFPHKIDLFVQVYENILDKLGNHVPPHKLSHYRVGLIKEGSANYTCGIYKFSVGENTLLIIPPRVVTSSTDWNPESKGYFVMFNLDFFLQSHFPYRYLENKKILQPSVQPYIQLTSKNAASVEQIFKAILLENQLDRRHKKEMIALKILELLIMAERMYLKVHQLAANETKVDLVKKFSDLVEANFQKERSVGFYASTLHVHPNYLNALIKSQNGMTAKDSIQHRLLLEAKYLLHSTTLSVKEISGQLGFDDPNYFTVFFKRFEELSPMAYRKQHIL